MQSLISIPKKSLAFSAALALGFLLMPVTVTSEGVEASIVCGAEGAGPDGNCTFSLQAICKFDGEYMNNFRRVIN
jgi:hypothetical protein